MDSLGQSYGNSGSILFEPGDPNWDFRLAKGPKLGPKVGHSCFWTALGRLLGSFELNTNMFTRLYVVNRVVEHFRFVEQFWRT